MDLLCADTHLVCVTKVQGGRAFRWKWGQVEGAGCNAREHAHITSPDAASATSVSSAWS